MNTKTTPFEDFVAFSGEVTGFREFDLLGTGQATAYYDAAVGVVGEARIEAIGQRWRAIEARTTDSAEREAALRRELLSDPELGPIARNIIKLWYVATWYQLPATWREGFGALKNDTTFVVSPAAYPEGVLWKTIGANPPGAKGPGYGTWAEPPRIPEF